MLGRSTAGRQWRHPAVRAEECIVRAMWKNDGKGNGKESHGVLLLPDYGRIRLRSGTRGRGKIVADQRPWAQRSRSGGRFSGDRHSGVVRVGTLSCVKRWPFGRVSGWFKARVGRNV
jgi:hypothetical protein